MNKNTSNQQDLFHYFAEWALRHRTFKLERSRRDLCLVHLLSVFRAIYACPKGHDLQQPPFGGDQGFASVFGRRYFADPRYAAFTNAYAAGATNLIGGSRVAACQGGAFHPLRSIGPAVIAKAEADDLLLEDALKALLIGCEAAFGIRGTDPFILQADNGHYRPPSESYGNAAAIAFLSNLQVDEFARAMSISGAIGPLYRDSDWSQSAAALSSAYSARTGFDAAQLSSSRCPTPRPVLDTRFSLHNLKENTKRFELERAYVKREPVCRFVEGPLNNLRLLVEKNGIVSSQIKSIDVNTVTEASYCYNRVHINKNEKILLTEMQTSIPFVLARHISSNSIGGDESLLEACSIQDRVYCFSRLEHDSVYPFLGRPSSVTVKLECGASLTKASQNDWGEPELFPTLPDYIMVLERELGPHLGQRVFDKFADLVIHKSSNITMRELTASIVGERIVRG